MKPLASGVDVSPLEQHCPECGVPNRGRCDTFFRFVESVCGACGHAWAAKLTDKQRWALLHPQQADPL